MPRGLNALAKEFHDWLVDNEYGVHEGTTNGGHQRYRLRNGRIYIGSSTPSAYTAVANAKAQVRRELGVQSDSPKSGKYVHKKTDGFDGKVTLADRYPTEVGALIRRVHDVDDEIMAMQSRQNVFLLRKLASKRVYLASQLQKYGVTVDPPHKAS